MMFTYGHPEATCPKAGCDGGLSYGLKEEANDWKVYYMCERCHWEQMARRVRESELEEGEGINQRAEEIGERWA